MWNAATYQALKSVWKRSVRFSAADIPVPESQDESLSQEQSLLSQFGDVPKYGTKGYDDFRAFAAIRMETPEAMKWLKKRRAYSNKPPFNRD